MSRNCGLRFTRHRWLALGLAVCLSHGLVRPAAAQMSQRAPIPNGQMRSPTRNPERTIQVYVWSYKELQRRHIVMQNTDYSCGAAALATVVRYYWGDDVGESFFLERMPKLNFSEADLKDRVEKGLTLTDLRNLARAGGYEAEMGTVTYKELTEAKVPLIVGLKTPKYDHFAVFRGTDNIYVYLADPSRGNIRIEVPEFAQQWQKNAVLAVAKPNTKVKDVNPMAVRDTEAFRGATNRQYVRRQALTPPFPYPVQLGP